MLPPSHSLRSTLHDEIHARPPEALPPRATIYYLALSGSHDAKPVVALCERLGVSLPDAETKHFSGDFGPFRLKWERHTEFTRYKVIVPRDETAGLFQQAAFEGVPSDWLAALPGEVIVANIVELAPAGSFPVDRQEISKTIFNGNVVIGSRIAGGAATAYTDFRIGADGFGRYLLLDNELNVFQRGRTIQRLMEIDTYRMMALLTLPIAQNLMGVLSGLERELDAVTMSMTAATHVEEPALLDKLTAIHSQVVREQTASQFRFSATRAYWQLVEIRNRELREEVIAGLQTFAGYRERRIGPAMRTCEAAQSRLEALSERVSRATQLLSTRVDIVRETQNQALLESMDRRASMQLRLQETVEGLSVAAITYYVVSLVGYAAENLKAIGWLPVSKAHVVLASIPLAAALVFFAIRRVRHSAQLERKPDAKG